MMAYEMGLRNGDLDVKHFVKKIETVYKQLCRIKISNLKEILYRWAS